MKRHGTDPWHVLRYNPSAFRAPFETLLRLHPDAEVYMPMFQQKSFIRRQRKVVMTWVSLAPGYAFVRGLGPYDLVGRPISNLFGFLRDASRAPITVDHHDVRSLFVAAQETGVPNGESVAPETPLFAIGDKVSFKSFSMDGLEASITRLLDHGVELELSDGGPASRVFAAYSNIRAA